MPRILNNHRLKDMYWFAHGGYDTSSEHPAPKECIETEDDSSDLGSHKSHQEHSISSEEASLTKSVSLDRPDSGSRASRMTVDNRIKQTSETEQEKNDPIARKAVERQAVFEARRNAQRAATSFAFGSSAPVGGEFDIAPVQLHAPSNHVPVPVPSRNETDNLMSMSMTASMCVTSTRGRRKNDLTPALPYDRTGSQQRSITGAIKKRSVSMSRLDFLAKPRKHYVEAQKANSSISNSSSVQKETSQSPKRPLSSASEKSKVGHVSTRRAETRKPRPVSIAGNVPDKTSQSPRTTTPLRKPPVMKKPEKPSLASREAPKYSSAKPSTPPKTTEKPKQVSTKPSTPKPTPAPKPTPKTNPSKPKISTPKSSPSRKLTNKKQAAILVATATESLKNVTTELPKQADDSSIGADDDSHSTEDKSSAKHIISKEEAKAALAEKRKLAREMAEKEAALQQQQNEEERKAKELERLREEEKQRKMEEEQLRLLEEHRKYEEQKLQKAIEEHEKQDAEDKAKREDEARLKSEQEKKSKEEAEKQRIEMEEKLRKEEEERAERKKRLDKIMSRTRGGGGGGSKSGTASPCGSLNGSEPLDSIENQPLSSEPSSLDSIEQLQNMDQPNSHSYDLEEALDLAASHSLSSNDLMIPSSDRTSLDTSAAAFPSEPTSLETFKEDPFAEQFETKEQDSVDDKLSTSVEEPTLKATELLLDVGDHIETDTAEISVQVKESTCDSDKSDTHLNSQKDISMLPNFSSNQQGNLDCITSVNVHPLQNVENQDGIGSSDIIEIKELVELPSASIIPDGFNDPPIGNPVLDKDAPFANAGSSILTIGNFSDHPENLLDMDGAEIGKSTVVLEKANGDFVVEHPPEDANIFGNPFLDTDLSQDPFGSFAETTSGNPFSSDLLPGTGFSATLNPFGSVEYQDGGIVNNPQRLPSRNGFRSAIDFIPEESEDSSLDSNMSQVVNVNSNYTAFSEDTTSIASDGTCNGQSQPHSADSIRESNHQEGEGVIIKPNGLNGSSHDDSVSSAVHKADQTSDLSSEKVHLPKTNGNGEIMTMLPNDRDVITKAASNPFAGDNETNPFSSNPF